jgi:hypothetical protein
LEIVPGDHFARMFEQHRQDLPRLFAKSDPRAAFSELACGEVDLVTIKTDDCHGVLGVVRRMLLARKSASKHNCRALRELRGKKLSRKRSDPVH